MGARLFYSYAHGDAVLANQVADVLRKDGIDAAAFDGAPGEDFAAGLRHALDRSDAVVMLLSGSASDSPFLMAELGAAMALDKRIVVVRPDRAALPISFPPNHVRMVEAAGLSPDEIAATVRAQLAA